MTGEEMRRELRTISRTSTAGLAPKPKPRLPQNAYALSNDGNWALLVAQYYASCKRCGKKLHRRQKIAWNVETRESRCTRCVQEVAFSPTRYGRRRKQGHQAHQQDRKRRAADGMRYRDALRELEL